MMLISSVYESEIKKRIADKVIRFFNMSCSLILMLKWLNFFKLPTATSLHIVLLYLITKLRIILRMKIMIKSVFPIYTFNLFWILGLLHICFYGTRPYRHYRFEDLVDPSPAAVFMVCALYSMYFLTGNVLKFTPFWVHHRYNAYIFLSVVLIFQSFIACMGAMHAPPYWAAFIINCMFVLLAHFVLYPIFALWRKYSK